MARRQGAETNFNAALPASDDDIEFTWEAINGCTDVTPYRTLRLSGSRRTEDGSSKLSVDIYEMHWADLSSLGSWIGKILGEFYQILFHLASLGQKTVELAWLRADPAIQKALRPVLISQTICESLLACVLPVLNLALLLGVLPLFLSTLHSEGTQGILLAVLVVVLVAYLRLQRLWQRAASPPEQDWDLATRILFALLLAVSVGGIVALALHYGIGAKIATFLSLSIAMFWPFFWCVHKLAERRVDVLPNDPGRAAALATSCPWIVGGLITIWWLILLSIGVAKHLADSSVGTPQVALLLGQGLYIPIVVVWTAFTISAWITVIVALRAAKASNSEDVKAALWTGTIGLFVPASLFLCANVLGWWIVTWFLKKPLGDETYKALVVWPDLFAPIQCNAAAHSISIHDCVDGLLKIAAGGFNAFFVVIFVAALLVIVALLPSVLAETSPLRQPKESTSFSLGNWLTAGVGLSRRGGYLLIAGILVVIPLGELAAWWYGERTAPSLIEALRSPSLLVGFGTALLASAGAIVAFRNVLFKGLARALGIAFDVDNWLKERPIQKNPRGKILLRYIALLRHICSRNYSRLVIVSHSQGTVISADLLRFLKVYAPELQLRLPAIRFMTFGCPLRQLYAARFPQQYGWAGGPNANPMPSGVGAEAWLNGYRSGDYVGRALWNSSTPWKPIVPEKPLATPTSECCLAAGAHTHYFDETATEVGKLIDVFVATSKSQAQEKAP